MTHGKQVALVLAILAIGCKYNAHPPDGVVVCQGSGGCPSGYRCLPRPGEDPVITVCCQTAACGTAGTVSEPDAALSLDSASAPEVASDRGPGPDSETPADVGADRGVDLAPAVDIASPDLAPEAGPDVPPDAASCPPTSHGPALVRADGFCIDSTEVTNVQYLAFVKAKADDVSGQGDACKWNTSYVPGGDMVVWPPLPGTDNHPVGSVDWCDAFAYCQWAGKRLCGRVTGGRLPSMEAGKSLASQWTIACSANGSRTYAYGPSYNQHVCNTDAANESISHLENVMNRAGCVGGYPGLWDMSGNVEEWIDACDKDTGAGDNCGIAGSAAFIDKLTPKDLTCTGSVFGQARSTRFVLLGFRCCAD
jgi:sulfatase modifying factor 1